MADFFDGKAFLVTGASSGIGEAVARRLVERGARVAAMARTEPKLRELAAVLGERCLAAPGDVTREEDCARAVAETIRACGRLDGIVHSAGVSMRALARETKVQVYRDLMEVNFFSMLFLFRAAVEPLVKTKGHLVAISSMMGLYSTQKRSGYAAAKHALQGFMDSVRLELHGDGVHVMTVSPGFVKTNISLHALSADGTPHGQVDPAIERGLDPRVVADAILRGMERRARDVFPAGGKEKLGLFLSKWAPKRLDRFLLGTSVT